MNDILKALGKILAMGTLLWVVILATMWFIMHFCTIVIPIILSLCVFVLVFSVILWSGILVALATGRTDLFETLTVVKDTDNKDGLDIRC